ncbi:MAG TPA: Rap1a/Tai family immunity protein [Hyphomicrobiaceae bacterium]|nr:Rap1a/Tai family immunity protein [Hyphomicrobiaceae bacterium]
MRLCVLAGAIVLHLAAMASAGQAEEFFSGEKLLEICTAGEQGSDTGAMFCNGYISGVYDVLSNPAENEICLPDAVVLAEMQAGIVGFLRDNAELLDFGAAGLVKKALVLRYPCEKKL